MAPRKEPKEQVVYPASKSKVPAFKPLRPLARVPSIESARSKVPQRQQPAKKPSAPKRKAVIALSDSEDQDDNDVESLIKEGAHDDVSLEEIVSSKPPAKRKTTERERPVGLSDDLSGGGKTEEPPMPSQSDHIPAIPQPLLLRLLHESFSDTKTTIDKHAIQVVQKYMEIFVRETIARCALEKKEAADRGEVGAMDAGWLDVEDLEKVAVGMLMDF